MRDQLFLDAAAAASFDGAVIDCRFDLQQPQAGRSAYAAGHIPGAHFLDLEDDLSAPRGKHGGRHPLPPTAVFAARLAAIGVDQQTPILIYDGGEVVFAAHLWWMLRALGYGPLRVLAGGFAAWEAAGRPLSAAVPDAAPVAVPEVVSDWPQCCDRDGLRELQASGARLVDARDGARYRGEHEPIDPVAGHIPGALNRPWMDLTHAQQGLRGEEELRTLWGDLLDARPLVVYCGSGISACVNLMSLAALGRDDAWLYGGSWSDWCSYLDAEDAPA
jgi:thiosulfate/3-mercaptopyruvate sulfurtransferase